MSTNSYPISAPVEFVNTTPGDLLDFNAVVGGGNLVKDFVTAARGDLIYAASDSADGGQLTRLPIGGDGQVLTTALTTQQIAIIPQADVGGNTYQTYFQIGAAGTQYFVWLDTDAGGVAPGGTGTAVQVDNVVTGSTGPFIASEIKDAIDAIAGTPFTTVLATTVVANDTLIITNADNTAPGSDPVNVDLLVDQFVIVTPGGLNPSWQTPATGAGGTTTAVISFQTDDIPTTVTNNWYLLSDTGGGTSYVTYATTGPNFSNGTYTTPAAGVYDISANIVFEANNRGTNGLISDEPIGRAVRQAAIVIDDTAAAGTLTWPGDGYYSSRQAEASSQNQTVVSIPSVKLTLSASQTISLKVRHDSNSTLEIQRGYLSIHRVS